MLGVALVVGRISWWARHLFCLGEGRPARLQPGGREPKKLRTPQSKVPRLNEMETADLSVAIGGFQLIIRVDIQNFSIAAIRAVSSAVRQLVSDHWLLDLGVLVRVSSISSYRAIGLVVASIWTPSVRHPVVD
jgi:hypothetical protein